MLWARNLSVFDVNLANAMTAIRPEAKLQASQPRRNSTIRAEASWTAVTEPAESPLWLRQRMGLTQPLRATNRSIQSGDDPFTLSPQSKTSRKFEA